MADDNLDDMNKNNEIEYNVAIEEDSVDLYEQSDAVSVDEKKDHPFIAYCKNNKKLVGTIVSAISIAIVAILSWQITKPVEQVRFEDVVPNRIDGSQSNIIREKTIPGAGKGTITIADPMQNNKNVSAPWFAVDATGNDDAATLTVPEDIGAVGWYGRSAPPGVDSGSTVMTSHINYAGVTGYGALFLTLKPGSPITVTTDDGKNWHYVVEQNMSVDKASNDEEKERYKQMTSQTVNKMDGKNFLVLITCSGNFDPNSELGYDQNTIVTAKLISQD